MSKAKVEKVYWDIMVRLYAESDPPLDLNAYLWRLKLKHRKAPDNWFMNYYLDIDRQQEIVEEELNKHKLTKWERANVKINVYLGFSPAGTRKELREEAERLHIDEMKD